MSDEKRLYTNAAGDKLVVEDSPEAAFFITADEANARGLIKSKEAPEAYEAPDKAKAKA